MDYSTRIHFLLPGDGKTYGPACSPAILVVGGMRAVVISKRLTPHIKLVTCRVCRHMVEAARSERRERQ